MNLIGKILVGIIFINVVGIFFIYLQVSKPHKRGGEPQHLLSLDSAVSVHDLEIYLNPFEPNTQIFNEIEENKK